MMTTSSSSSSSFMIEGVSGPPWPPGFYRCSFPDDISVDLSDHCHRPEEEDDFDFEENHHSVISLVDDGDNNNDDDGDNDSDILEVISLNSKPFSISFRPSSSLPVTSTTTNQAIHQQQQPFSWTFNDYSNTTATTTKPVANKKQPLQINSIHEKKHKMQSTITDGSWQTTVKKKKTFQPTLFDMFNSNNNNK